MTTPIPSAQLDLSGLAPGDRLEAWRAVNPAHEVAATETMARDSGPVGLAVWHLGPLLLARSQLGSLRLSRGRAQIRHDHIDHVAIAVGRGGQWRTGGSDVGFDMAKDQVSVVDMAQPIDTELNDASAFQLVVPREGLAGLDPAAAHGTLLQSPVAGLFVDYIHALERHLPHLGADDLPNIARITVDLLAASMKPSAATVQRARPGMRLSLLQRVRRHIERQLHDPALSPESIAASLRMSRARLYQLLEEDGGVAAYVWQRRLARAHALLRGTAAQPIKEIAYQVGFTSEAHFSRAFRRQYGCSPSEMRACEAVPATPTEALGAADTWLHWLRTLG